MNAITLKEADNASDVEVIGLVGLAHGASHFFHLLLPPLYPWLMKDFNLSFTQLGFLMTVFFVISGAGQAIAGFLVDRVGARPVLFGGLALLACSGLLLAVADSYAALILVAAVAGLGNCIFHPADFTLLNRLVRHKSLGHAFSVHGLTGTLGWAFAPVTVSGVTLWTGNWHVAGLAAAAIAFIVLGVLLVRREALNDVAATPNGQSDRPLAPRTSDALPERGFRFLNSSAVWMSFLFFFFATAAFGILQNFSPTVLHEVYGVPLTVATAGLTAFLIGSALGNVAGGFLALRVARSDRVIAGALGAAALFALMLASGWLSADWVLPAMVLMGLGTGTAGPSRDLLVRRAATARFGKASFGRVYGFVYSGLDLGLALSPLVFGPWMDAGHFGAVLSAVAALQVAALLSAVWVGRSVKSSV